MRRKRGSIVHKLQSLNSLYSKIGPSAKEIDA